jgi:hypothetical protein
VDAIAGGISAHLNRRAGVYLALFSAWYFALAAGQAGVRPMWHDELFTAYLLRVPSAGQLWDALASGVDLMPPLYHLIVRFLAPVFGDGALALRLPSLVGFWVMCLCIYRYVSRRLPAEFAFAAMLLPFCTNAAYYMAEARPYGLVLGLAALALVSWQSLEAWTRLRVIWLAVLAVSLAAAITAHYYAVLLLLPLVAGEIVRSRTRGSIDWAVWICLAAPMSVLLALRPLLATAREFAPTFWTSPQVGEAVLVYTHWFGHSDWVFILIAGIAATAIWRQPSATADRDVPHPPLHDVVAALVLLGLPVAGAMIAFATGAGFAWRYVLPGIIGFSIAGAWVLARIAGRSLLLRLAMVAVLALNYETLFRSRDLLTGNVPVSLTSRIEERVRQHDDSSAPVLVASPHVFLELLHYGSPSFAARVRYLSNPERAMALSGTDTADRALALLARQVSIPVGRFPDDLPAETTYYIVDVEPLNWLAQELLRRDAKMALSGWGDGFAVYRVRTARELE